MAFYDLTHMNEISVQKALNLTLLTLHWESEETKKNQQNKQVM
jgi:hypothetical protein